MKHLAAIFLGLSIGAILAVAVARAQTPTPGGSPTASPSAVCTPCPNAATGPASKNQMRGDMMQIIIQDQSADAETVRKDLMNYLMTVQ
jgi:hypothetical protein